jgi:hypothetical protein
MMLLVRMHACDAYLEKVNEVLKVFHSKVQLTAYGCTTKDL